MHHAGPSRSANLHLDARQLRAGLCRLCLAATLASGVALLSIGCASPPPPPVVDALPYQGPPVAMGSKNGEHIAIITAPTPGWVPSLDRVMDGPGARQVFISLREPNPAFLRAQVTVDQHIATTVPLREGARIHVRTLRWDQEDLEDVPFFFAASAAAMALDQSPPQPTPAPATPPPQAP